MNSKSYACGACLAALLLVGAATAAPLPAAMDLRLEGSSVEAQAYPRTREFRSCMRGKYGPRYFAGVRRAYRWHMAQACMA
jgi:hypothetical protein